ncbi:hypothetical protein KIPB_006685, partial [Kipferlia bialata]
VGDIKYLFSFVCGLASVGLWIFAQFPQLLKNYRLKRVDSLSYSFLVFWITGDLANIVGALLTHALPTQIVSGVYFCLMDTTLLLQFMRYRERGEYTKMRSNSLVAREDNASMAIVKELRSEVQQGEDMDVRLVLHPLALYALVALSLLSHTLGALASSPSLFGEDAGDNSMNTLSLSEEAALGWDFWVGWGLGWVSALFYMAGRVSQIIKNYKEKSPETLSIGMFVIAVLGNATYSLSIAFTVTCWDDIWPQIPWVLGSAGVMCLDFTIAVQWVVYTRRNKEALPADVVCEGVEDSEPSAALDTERARDRAESVLLGTEADFALPTEMNTPTPTVGQVLRVGSDQDESPYVTKRVSTLGTSYQTTQSSEGEGVLGDDDV